MLSAKIDAWISDAVIGGDHDQHRTLGAQPCAMLGCGERDANHFKVRQVGGNQPQPRALSVRCTCRGNRCDDVIKHGGTHLSTPQTSPPFLADQDEDKKRPTEQRGDSTGR